MSELFEAQKTLYAALVAAKICDGRVYNDAPQDVVFPHVEIGDPLPVNDWHSGTVGTELTVTLHVWSRYDGNRECLDIYAAIRNAIDGVKLNHGGQGQVIAYVLGGPIQRDPDGKTRQGLIRVTLSHQE